MLRAIHFILSLKLLRSGYAFSPLAMTNVRSTVALHMKNSRRARCERDLEMLLG